ncbi:MAG TPA: SDR family NAD(P)-dependent oxidoreductase [Candidatus Baltobacteraceae bacterium]
MTTILITGASSGIGRALALRAVRAGLCVVGVGRDATRLGELTGVATLVADVGEAGAAKRIVSFALEKCGRIDVLVNNAGEASAGALVEQTDEALRRQFATHVTGPIALVREALPALQAARGHVVMVGSGVARVPVDGLGAYSPAKAALRSATSLLRRELQRFGVAVTYVDPGVVDTPFMERAGLAGAPKPMRVSPEVVARKIWSALAKRPRELNAVPWQTAAVALGEHFPRVTDAFLSRTAHLVGTQNAPQASPPPSVIPSVAPSPSEGAESRDSDPLESALEPHARRMERSGLRIQFVRELLVPGAQLEAGEIAMRWAGMPNKHERALTVEVLQALEVAGYLEHSGDDAWTVKAPTTF